MDHDWFMMKQDSQMKIRLPEGLKADIEKSARESGHSMNAEILARLEGEREGEQSLRNFLKDEEEELEWLISSAKKEYENLSTQLRDIRNKMVAHLEYDPPPLGGLIIEHRWAAERLNDYERRLRRIKRVLGETE